MRLKVWLVVLLAVIFSVKGAMAAIGMACHVPAPGASHPQQMPHEAGLSAHEAHGAHDMSAAHEATAPQGDEHGSAADAACRVCAAICGASVLPPAIADRVPALDPVRDWYVLAVPIPPPLTLAGLERPPRTV